jgi:hypothetical protein
VQKKLKQKAEAHDRALAKAALKLVKEQVRSAKARRAPTPAAPPTTACAARLATLVALPGIVPPPAPTVTAHPTDSCVGHTVAIDPFSLCWNKFHNFYLQKGLWSNRAGLVNEKSQRLEFCRRQTSSLLNKNKNAAMGLEDHRGRKLGSKNL